MEKKQFENGRSFLEIDLMEINQGGSSFFVGKVPAKSLLDLYTVEPAIYKSSEYSTLASSFDDDREYYEHLKKDISENVQEKMFQRELKKDRVKEIKEFLETSSVPFFPNTVIITCDLINEVYGLSDENPLTDEILSEIPQESNLSYYFSNDGHPKLYTPTVPNSFLIIDGQHRVGGLSMCRDNVVDNYDVLVAFIIGFDKSVIANLFYTVNYNQKPVNRSLLYHLMGEFNKNLDEITFMHQVVRLLNEIPRSPLCERIKMLGVSPKDLSLEKRNLATISQAFLVDELLSSISPVNTNSLYQPIFYYYYSKKELQIEIARFLIKYLNAIKEVFQDQWNDVDNFVLSKSVSIGAFLKVFRLIYIKSFVDDHNCDPRSILTMTKDNFVENLRGAESIDFSSEGDFGRVGSGGTLSKIKKEIIIAVPYLCEDKNYQNFETSFKEQYIERFKNWFSDQT